MSQTCKHELALMKGRSAEKGIVNSKTSNELFQEAM
jgi:hypothetical protein